MMRQPDWKLRLIQYLSEAARTPFAPGRHDCALFAAGAVEAMTGMDYARPFKGRYTTLKGGLRILREAGFADAVALAAAWLPEIAPAFAAPGDLAVIDTAAGPALGVVQGAGIYVLTPDRLGVVPLLGASRAFRVT